MLELALSKKFVVGKNGVWANGYALTLKVEGRGTTQKLHQLLSFGYVSCMQKSCFLKN